MMNFFISVFGNIYAEPVLNNFLVFTLTLSFPKKCILLCGFCIGWAAMLACLKAQAKTEFKKQ